MPDFMNPSADLQAGIAAGWAEGQRQIENMQDEIEHLEKELDEQRARAQSLEATLVLTEDQRDAARKERDDWLAALKREQSKHLETLHAAIAERDARSGPVQPRGVGRGRGVGLTQTRVDSSDHRAHPSAPVHRPCPPQSLRDNLRIRCASSLPLVIVPKLNVLFSRRFPTHCERG